MLKDGWSPAMNLTKVLKTLTELLWESEQFDPHCALSVRSWLSELKRVEPGEYARKGREHTQAHANFGLGIDDISAALIVGPHPAASHDGTTGPGAA